MGHFETRFIRCVRSCRVCRRRPGLCLLTAELLLCGREVGTEVVGGASAAHPHLLRCSAVTLWIMSMCLRLHPPGWRAT